MIRRRKPLRSKGRPAVRKVSWRSGCVRETSAGMARLRADAYYRSQGLCECWRDKKMLEPCGKRVRFIDGQLHHLVSRARGGSDVLENVAFIRWQCHRKITGEPQWSRH